MVGLPKGQGLIQRRSFHAQADPHFWLVQTRTEGRDIDRRTGRLQRHLHLMGQPATLSLRRTLPSDLLTKPLRHGSLGALKKRHVLADLLLGRQG